MNPDFRPETCGFNSTRSPPFTPELKEFEDGLALLIENIRFRKFDNEFQELLRNDLNKIKREKKLLIRADKTSNYYNLSSEQYESLITKGIQKEYKKANDSTRTDPDRFWSVPFRFVFPPTKLQTRNDPTGTDPTRSEAYTYFLSSV